MTDSEKPALRPANENPWYCLATLYGEQPIDAYDRELAEKNRQAWSRWFADISGDQRRNLATAFERRADGRPLMPPERSARPDFSNTRFDRRVVFKGFPFEHHPCDFRSANFCADADFSEAQIDSANFSSAIFSAEANFSRTRFNILADFQSATFSGKTMFAHANLVRPNFAAATFNGAAHFESATFHQEAQFRSAKFADIADFRLAQFKSRVDFGSTVFSGLGGFTNATFSETADFEAATFSRYINFINAKFSERTLFNRVRFERVPDFRGATMHEATEWHGVAWPKPPESKLGAQVQVYNYERLKQEMERLKKHEDEQRFFRKELRARRALARPWSGEWTLNLLYQASSNYGYSIALPLIWLFGLFITGGAVFYLVHANPNSGVLTIWHAAALSFGNIFPFVPIAKELMGQSPVIGWSRIEKAIAVGQTLLGAPLLFLLGLALRNRFRMK